VGRKLLGDDEGVLVKLFLFGGFVADPLLGVLRKDSVVIPITPKAFEVLVVLIERRGQVVEKDQIMKLVWPDTVVEENNLVRHISTVRKALDDHPPVHQYIVTIPGRGYRFVASVREVERPGETALHAEPSQPTPAATDAVPSDAIPLLTPPALTRRFAVQPVAVAVVCILLASITAVAAFVLRRPVTPGAQPASRLWQLTLDSGLQNEPSWSPDGKRIAYATDRAGNLDIWTQSIGGRDPIRVTASSEHDWQPAWSPSGEFIAFRSERQGGGIFVVPAVGGPERRVADFGFKPRWSPDGAKILFNGSYQPTVREAPTMFVVGLDGGAPKSVFSDLLAKLSGFSASWHPDGRISIYGGVKDEGRQFFTVPLAGGTPHQSEMAPSVAQKLREMDVRLTNFVWSPTGDALFFEGKSEGVQNLWRITVDPHTLRWLDGPDRLTTGTGLDDHITLSPDGRRLAFSRRTERTSLWSFPFDNAAGRLTGPGEPVAAEVMDASYDISPDGHQLVYRTSHAGIEELWTRSLDSGQDRMLTAGASIMMPRWSPDGTQLVFRRQKPEREGGRSIERADILLAADGGRERPLTTPQATTPGAIDLAPFDWSSDGERILTSCSTTPNGPAGLCTFPVSGAPHAELARRVVASKPNLGLYQARFSPNDRWICFNAVERSGKSVIYAAPTDGGPWTAITEGQGWEDKPRWAVDGKTIYFASNRGGFINIWGRHFDQLTGQVSGDAFQVTAFKTPRQMIFPYMKPLQVVFTKDRLIVPVTESAGSIWVLENIH
jgi:Tol biopolymer transport system component/DNA-binding winged helix-turn-helix (wHTH) protein